MSAIAAKIESDRVISFEINRGTLLQFLETRADGGPRLKCVEGSVTLVSPGTPHENAANRLDRFIFAICLELKIKHRALLSTTWTLPLGGGDTAYEADKAYYIQSQAAPVTGQSPDLAIEVVVSNPPRKALLAGSLLKIPEMWVMDVPRHKLTFYLLTTRGIQQGVYKSSPRSRVFPTLRPAEVIDRLDDSTSDDIEFHENCRTWAREVLSPRTGISGK